MEIKHQLSHFIPKVESASNYSLIYLGDNCIQNFHLGRYIVGYMVENLVYGNAF